MLLVATVMDIHTGRIQNQFLLISLIAGLIHQILRSGLQTIPTSLMGLILSILILFPLFMIKGLGAGDVKLFGIIGFFLSSNQYRELFTLMFAALIIGVIQAVILTCVKRRYQKKIHFTIPILLSTILYTGGFY
ncbi:MAG: A24 family peptidase [Lachnospiraceae bacterium]|nr:A24 family peptidase [Lachnospiraceae bacterium]